MLDAAGFEDMQIMASTRSMSIWYATCSCRVPA